MFFLAALLPPLLWGLWKAHKDHQHENSQDHGNANSRGTQGESEADAAAREAADAERESQRAKALKESEEAAEARLREEARRHKAAQMAKAAALLKGDPRLAHQMLRKAGFRPEQYDRALFDEQTPVAVAAHVSDEVLEILTIASRSYPIDLNLKLEDDEQPVRYPADDIRPAPMTGLEQLSAVLPQQTLMSDEEFFTAAVQGELLVMQSYERTVRRKLLYILLDGSPSMQDGKLKNGFPRHVTARGIVIHLLLKAVDGEARYLMRYFDNRVRELIMVQYPGDAEMLITRLLDTFEQGSGTDVLGAFETAAKDILTRGGEFSNAEVLVASDCTDGTGAPIGRELVERMAGKNIRLHVAAVGIQSHELKAAAATYVEFL